jgi:DNA polymerase-3 subunit delta
VSSSAYLLTGHPLLAEEALARVRAELGIDPLSEASFDPSAAPAEIVAALETPSLLGGLRLVVVHHAHALSRDQSEALATYLASPSPHAVLVLVASGRTRLADAVRSVGEVIAVEAPRGRRLVAWVRERARGAGLRVEDRAGWGLIESVGPELRDLEAAVEQLATALPHGSRVGAADVRRMFARHADQRIYAFTDAVGDRRLDVAMTALRRLLDQGEEPLVIFGALTSQVRRMLVAREVIGGARAVGDTLGLPEWRAERVQRQARSYREEDLTAAIGALATADVEMKGGDLPSEIALERAVVEIVAGEGER